MVKKITSEQKKQIAVLFFNCGSLKEIAGKVGLSVRAIEKMFANDDDELHEHIGELVKNTISGKAVLAQRVSERLQLIAFADVSDLFRPNIQGKGTVVPKELGELTIRETAQISKISLRRDKDGDIVGQDYTFHDPLKALGQLIDMFDLKSATKHLQATIDQTDVTDNITGFNVVTAGNEDTVETAYQDSEEEKTEAVYKLPELEKPLVASATDIDHFLNNPSDWSGFDEDESSLDNGTVVDNNDIIEDINDFELEFDDGDSESDKR